ncbi:hypothetical protein B7P43_G14612 [Cryptotermes secundus]|uniref:Uncharacterized protein n=1 Tax=Cryptotermes secundus TaxID=105785 RepID=A0A2J7RS90_9NEOP|nr:hypothetical protein B7P43_G14612 [Cryptotermes secundus]
MWKIFAVKVYHFSLYLFEKFLALVPLSLPPRLSFMTTFLATGLYNEVNS